MVVQELLLSYIASSRPPWAMEDLFSKQKGNRTLKQRERGVKRGRTNQVEYNFKCLQVRLPSEVLLPQPRCWSCRPLLLYPVLLKLQCGNEPVLIVCLFVWRWSRSTGWPQSCVCKCVPTKLRSQPYDTIFTVVVLVICVRNEAGKVRQKSKAVWHN